MRRHAAGGDPPASPLDDDGRPCARGDWCTSPAAVIRRDAQGRRTVEPEYGPRAFCEADRAAIRDALADLPARHLDLHTRLLEADTGQMSEGRPAPPGSRLLIRAATDALIRQVTDILCDWHDRVAAVAGSGLWPLAEADPRMRYLHGTQIVTRAAEGLGPRLDMLLALESRPMRRSFPSMALMDDSLDPDAVVVAVQGDRALVRVMLGGPGAGLDILALHRRCLADLGSLPERPDMLDGVRCYDCHHVGCLVRAALPDRPGAPEWYSRCRRCGHLMSEEDYRRHVGRLAAAARGRIATEQLELAGGSDSRAVLARGWLAC